MSFHYRYWKLFSSSYLTVTQYRQSNIMDHSLKEAFTMSPPCLSIEDNIILLVTCHNGISSTSYLQPGKQTNLLVHISFALADMSTLHPPDRFPSVLVCDRPITTNFIVYGLIQGSVSQWDFSMSSRVQLYEAGQQS